MMYNIDFIIDGQKLSLEKTIEEKIIANSVNYLTFTFKFLDDSEWRDLICLAEFTYNRKTYLKEVLNNVAISVPPEVIKTPGFTVSVFGVNSTTDLTPIINKRITTNLLKVFVEASGDLKGDAPSEYETETDPYIISQEAKIIAERAEQKVDLCITAVSSMDARLEEIEEDIEIVAQMSTDYFDFKADAIETMTSLSLRQTQSESDIQIIYSEASELSGRVSSLETRATFLETDVSDIFADIQDIETQITSIEEDISNMDIDIFNLEGREEVSETRLTSLEDRATQVETRVTALEERAENIEEDISEVSALAQHADTRIISKEDTDFIIYNHLNIAGTLTSGSILNDGTVTSDSLYIKTDYMTIGTEGLCCKLNHIDVAYYSEDMTLTKNFMQKQSFVNGIIPYLEDSDYVIAYTETSNSNNLIVQDGNSYSDRVDFFGFDKELTTTIVAIVDHAIGNAINAEY